jgi:hypothetical protein
MVLLLSVFMMILLCMPGETPGQMRTETLLSACKEKTQVMKFIQGKPEVVGDRLDGLCHGYLVGVYDSLVERRIICAPPNNPTPEYLYSVLQRYLNADSSSSAKPVIEHLHVAYSRAFPCDEKRR